MQRLKTNAISVRICFHGPQKMSSNHSHETSQSGLVTDLIAGNFNEKLRLEGWTLHERLRNIVGYSTATNNLENWRRVVSPDSPTNFEKRLEWDGLTPAQAASALAPNTTQICAGLASIRQLGVADPATALC